MELEAAEYYSQICQNKRDIRALQRSQHINVEAVQEERKGDSIVFNAAKQLVMLYLNPTLLVKFPGTFCF